MGRLLLLSNLLVLLLVGCSLQTLPGKTTAKEVHEDVTERLQVISPRLFTTKMGVDGHVTGSSRQALALSVGNVLLGLGIPVLLRHTEIDDVNYISGLGSGPADEEVVGLNITVNEVLLVDGLHPRQLGFSVSIDVPL